MKFITMLFIIVLLISALFILELSQLNDDHEALTFLEDAMDQLSFDATQNVESTDQNSFSFESKTIIVYHYDEVLKVDEKKVCY